MTMTIADIDRELARYRNAADTVSTNLLELDRDPHRQLLDTAPLAGATATAWADGRSALSAVWDWFARFTTFLEQATALRASPRTRLAPVRERELADFLSQPTIELSGDEIPLQDRDLLQLRRETTRCTADELLTLMSDAFARAREVVTHVGAAWDDLAARVARARAALGEDTVDRSPAVLQQLDALTDALVTDPLSVTEDAVRDVEQAVAARTESAAVARQRRDELGARLGDARAELSRVEQDVAAAHAAHATARVKILDASLPEPPPMDDALTARLDDVVGLADAGRWDDAAERLRRWEVSVQELANAASASAAASRVPMTVREQLRGRLDAYRAKAHALGLDEDGEVTASYERARDALYVAPADLEAARELVERYQDLLTVDHEPEARR